MTTNERCRHCGEPAKVLRCSSDLVYSREEQCYQYVTGSKVLCGVCADRLDAQQRAIALLHVSAVERARDLAAERRIHDAELRMDTDYGEGGPTLIHLRNATDAERRATELRARGSA
jgi:hypothetical protein